MGDRPKHKDPVIEIYLLYRWYYYQGYPVVSDSQFDRYETLIREAYPDHEMSRLWGELTC